ncbi:Velvet multi-domain protein [Pyrenophora tritici-repentis]|nr:Velvet multi-domain protein [Pyrenophora tritici-repentis]KAI0573797.1 Velvet multi-domain protein [Pyrenophora tritici-repentis]KAI0607115.1 Velvet multi-domain protein [Pyrenophora tritici-repentis]KAI2488323.1 Velvet multi-domain protein [Pyrenophora tritici-repentis]PZC91697.1 Velvet domain containing protein [Pyrenophora tritici-repentis]
MTETQKLPIFSPPGFHDYSSRRLPPLEIPPDAVPPRSDHQFRSPINQLPSIHSGLPPRHDYHQPSSIHRSAAPVDKLLQHSNPYTPPRSDPPYSPQQYGPSISPRSEFDSRGPRRLTEPRYPYEEHRHYQHQHHQHPEQGYSSLTSPVEPSHQRPGYAPLPSPAYTPSYASSSSQFRTSVGSHQHAHSQRGSIGAPPGPIAYQEPPPVAPPARKQTRPIPLPGSIPQPVYNEQLNLNYELRVRQQPIAARACGFGERDRRVIDPPPIIQLLVTDPKTGIPDDDELRYSLNVVHCTLWNAEGTNEETALIQPDRRTTRRLMGQLVASPSVAKDEHDNEGCFFCFPDLSCRTHGKYRLRFVLMRIDPVNLHVGGFSPILTEVLSDVFTVYTAKDFPGMRPSSALTRALKLQGCNIQVKKGNEKALARKRLTASQEHDNIDDEELKRRRRE